MNGLVYELIEALRSDSPKQKILKMRERGELQKILPELIALDSVGGSDCGYPNKRPYFHKNNFYHSLEVLKNISEITTHKEVLVRLAALLHDIGKIPTRAWNEKSSSWTFRGHDKVGADMTKAIMTRWGFDQKSIDHVVTLIRLHMRHINISKDDTSKSAVRRFIKDAGPYLNDLLKLIKSDLTTNDTGKRARLQKLRDDLVKYIKSVSEEDKIREMKINIDGNDIMSILKIPPCDMLGEIKAEIKDLIIAGKLKNTYEDLAEYVRRIVIYNRE